MMSVAGQTKVASPGMARFQDFVLSTLTAAPNVLSVKTYVTIRRAKREPGVPGPEYARDLARSCPGVEPALEY